MINENTHRKVREHRVFIFFYQKHSKNYAIIRKNQGISGIQFFVLCGEV